jgi:predicted lactoylglutathione lyase
METSASFLIGEPAVVMMLFQEEEFKGYVRTEISDTKKGSEILLNIDAQSKAEVDAMAETVVKAGGKIFAEPEEAQGWMYVFGFEDVDGHRWSMLYMDTNNMPKG